MDINILTMRSQGGFPRFQWGYRNIRLGSDWNQWESIRIHGIPWLLVDIDSFRTGSHGHAAEPNRVPHFLWST